MTSLDRAHDAFEEALDEAAKAEDDLDADYFGENARTQLRARMREITKLLGEGIHQLVSAKREREQMAFALGMPLYPGPIDKKSTDIIEQIADNLALDGARLRGILARASVDGVDLPGHGKEGDQVWPEKEKGSASTAPTDTADVGESSSETDPRVKKVMSELILKRKQKRSTSSW